MTLSHARYIHATAVLIGGKGLLIRGPSRSGKSTLALDLLQGRHGLAAWLIGDDRIALENIGTRIEMRGHPRIAGKIEKRGATPLDSKILDVPFAASGLVDCVIELSDNALTPALSARRFCGADLLQVDLPYVDLPYVDLPHVDLPHVDLPHVDLPHVDLPHVDLPHVDLPRGIDRAGWVLDKLVLTD